jgi:hypothetical protein
MLYDINTTYKAIAEVIVFANEAKSIHPGTPRAMAARNLIIAAENLQELLDEFEAAPSYESLA